MTGDVILEAVNVVKHFGDGVTWLSPAPVVRAVDGVSLRVRRGETFAIVGESGCGKSTLARLLMRMLTPTSGDVLFDAHEIGSATGQALKTRRRDMQFIFQDLLSSLNPQMTVGKLVGEPLEVHAPELNAQGRRDKVAALLRKVGLRAEHAGRYPHEFSGGQRIGIARALASGPKLVIGDEPVSALDVSVQAQVINLLGDLSRDLGLTLVIIAHDLGVIRHMSDRVAVMYLGRIVEMGTTEQVYTASRHPYTQALLASIPALGRKPEGCKTVLGEMLSPSAPPPGCWFHSLAEKDGVQMVFGTPGGDQQDQWQLIWFLRFVHFGLNLQQCMDALLFHSMHFQGSFYPREVKPGEIVIEPDMGDDVIADLRARGHKVTVAESWTIGRLTAALRETNGTMRAAATPRLMQTYAVGQ